MTGSFLSILRVLALRGLGVLISLGTAVGIAFHFGAGPLTDAFFLVRRVFGSWVLLVDSLTSTLLVPAFVRRAQGQTKRAYLSDLQRSEWGFLALGALVAGLVFFFAAELVMLMAPGLDPEAVEAATLYFALMAFTLPITFSTAYAGAALAAIRQFSVPVALRLAPRLLILLAVLAVPFGMGMTQIVLAAVLGHAIMFVALILVRRHIAKTDAMTPAVPLTKPTETPARAAALTILAVYFLAVTISESYAASLVGVGAVAILGLGQRISTLGVSELLTSVLSVYYTNFSERAEDPEGLKNEMRAALRTGLFLTAPLTLCLGALAPALAQLVLANGAFSTDAATQAGQLVAWFALAALANTGMSILEAAILALSERRKVRHIFFACATALALRLAVMLALLPSWGLNAIGLAAVVGPVVVSLLYYRFLVSLIGSILTRALLRDLFIIFCLAGAAAGLCLGLQALWPETSGKAADALMLVLAVALAVPAYLAIATALGLEEARHITQRVTKRLRR